MFYVGPALKGARCRLAQESGKRRKWRDALFGSMVIRST